jgi:hypothetical protein
MNTKRIVLCSLVLAVSAYAPCGAQQLPVPATPLGALPAPVEDTTVSPGESNSLLPSNWIRYSQPDCCGAPGTCGGPIKSELYFRPGLAFPIGGGDFPRRLNSAGYTLQGGGRVLFFNEPRDKAWVVDLGISFFSDASDSRETVPLNILVQDGTPGAPNPQRRNLDVTIKHLYRTFANVGIGREYYLWAPADQPGTHWRVGADIGGRIGAAKADFNEIKHRTDNMWGAYVALHTDWEMACGSCVWFVGARCEYGYTWMGILQSQNNSDIGDMSVLLNLGVRF